MPPAPERPAPGPILYLRQFLDWVLATIVAFTALAGLGYLRFRDPGTGLTALTLFSYGCLLLWARAQLRLDRWRRIVLALCIGLLLAVLVLTMVQPDWLPALLVTPLIAVTVALPYANGRLAQGLIFGSWCVAVVVALIGEMREVPSVMPLWFVSFFRVSSFAAVFATVLLLLWQFSSRLTETLERTRAAEERYALAAQGVNDGLWDWDLRTNRVYFSPRWRAMLGLAESALEGSPDSWLQRLHPEDRAGVEALLTAHLDGQTPHFESEHRIRHDRGDYRWMLTRGAVVRDGAGRATRLAGSQTDITARKQIEAQLFRAAFHDGLTALPNRALFMDRLREATARGAQRDGYQFAVLFLDLDRFKVLNDSLGHETGDQLLVVVARRLRACVRQADTVARLGGDEFTVLLPDVAGLDEATGVAERILGALATPITLDKGEVFAGASIGIVLSVARYDEPEAYLRDADLALYQAKAQGRGRYAVFDQTLHQHAMARLQMETDLRRAIERQALHLAYQPIISLRSGHIVGFEALLRWHHPDQGPIPPKQFVPVAEETGMIGPLSWWTLCVACHQLRAWQEHFAMPLTMNVNWSRHLIGQPNVVGRIVALLAETGLEPRHLRLEITESVIMDDAGTMAAALADLRRLGVQLEIDDFGTGYSSLSTLHTFPISALKVDRSFVSRLDRKDDNLEIVQAIVTLAHNLGMNVTAEGVETATQLANLRALSCDCAQGYFFAAPLTPAEAADLLARQAQW